MNSIKTETTVKITYNGKPIYDVLKQACDLAHFVLEELSVYRQRNNLDPLTFECEGECCAFLDMMGD